MSSFMLRLFALLCMLVDHIGLALFPRAGLFRCIGRLSFPLYCFLLTQGYIHTRDVRAYGRRLLLLAILSEIPFDLLIFGRISSSMEMNVFFSLLLGLLALAALDHYRQFPAHAALCVAAVLVCSMLSRVSYGWLGVALCIAFFCAQGNRMQQALWLIALEALYILGLACSGVARSWVLASLCAMLAAIPILFYSGKPGPRSKALSFFFYIAYPLHIIALLIIRALRIVPPYFFG